MMITCKGLTIRVRGRDVVRDLDLSISGGEIALITGPTGSGKSLILKSIAGLIDVLYGGIETSGLISIFGLRPRDALVKGMTTYIPQDLESLLITNNFQEELELLKLVPNNYIIKSLNLEPLLRRSYRSLSAGERYRLLIGLAIHMNSKVLLIDEPSTYLDKEHLVCVLNLVRKLCSELGLIAIIADHRADVVGSVADKLYYVDGTTCCGLASIPKPKSDPKLRIGNVWYRYEGKGPWILRGVSTDINEGDVLVIHGPNGSGKTTLIKLISGSFKPSRGYVERYGSIFYIPQSPIYWFVGNNLYDEVRMANSSDIVLKLTGLTGKEGLNPYSLSVGEARRLAIYLGFYSGRSFIIVDEPTIGLDFESLWCLKELINEGSREGLAVIIATHDDELVHSIKGKVLRLEKASY